MHRMHLHVRGAQESETTRPFAITTITNLSILFTQSDVLELLILHELCLRERNTSLELCLTHLDRWD